MNPGTTTFTAATVLAATGLLFSNRLSWAISEAGSRTCRLVAAPAFSATDPPDASGSPVAICEGVEILCAAASVDANPPAGGAELWATELAVGSAEIPFEMASRIGITIIVSGQLSGGSPEIMHSGRHSRACH